MEIDYFQFTIKSFNPLQIPIGTVFAFTVNKMLLYKIPPNKAVHGFFQVGKWRVKVRQWFQPGKNRTTAGGHNKPKNRLQCLLHVAVFKERPIFRVYPYI